MKFQHGLLSLVLSGIVLCLDEAAACAEGHQCYEEPGTGITWVMRDEGQVNGGECTKVCQEVLCNTGTFHQSLHDQALDVFSDREKLKALLDNFNIECRDGGCWDGVSGDGMIFITRDENVGDDQKFTGDDGRAMTRRRCYMPADGKINALVNPGNANCFGERFSLLCPCEARELHNACNLWSSPPHSTTPEWPANPNGTRCIDRINYWRKRACDEGWPECPPCGLPPMVECEACHECTNSESEYDSTHGAHASSGRCGGSAAGQGGGATCSNVIDAFISERASNSDGLCVGHCGPIVRDGCVDFSWGRQDPANGAKHTLNWRGCNVEKCENYCANPTANECFRHALSPTPTEAPSPISTDDETETEVETDPTQEETDTESTTPTEPETESEDTESPTPPETDSEVTNQTAPTPAPEVVDTQGAGAPGSAPAPQSPALSPFENASFRSASAPRFLIGALFVIDIAFVWTSL